MMSSQTSQSMASVSKSVRVESASRSSPAGKRLKRTRSESSSGSSPDNNRDIDAMAISLATPVQIFGQLLALNVSLRVEAKPEIKKLCDEQGLLIFKLSRKASKPEYLELLPGLFALDEVNLKFVEAVPDQSSDFKKKMLEIADITYKLRMFCMGSSAEAGQGKGHAVCRFAGDLVGSILQVTMLIESNPTVAEYETLKDISTELTEEAAKVPKLFDQPLPSAVKECVLPIGLIRERLNPLMGSIAGLRQHLLALDTALYQMVRVLFVE